MCTSFTYAFRWYPTKTRNETYGTGTPYIKGVSRLHETRYLFWSEFAKVSIEYRYNYLFTHENMQSRFR